MQKITQYIINVEFLPKAQEIMDGHPGIHKLSFTKYQKNATVHILAL